MGKFKKLVLLCVSALLSIGLLSGCSTDGLALYGAMNKYNAMDTCEMKSSISVNLSATNLSASESQMMQQILPMVNGSKIDVTTKSKTNKDKTSSQAKMNINLKSGNTQIPAINADLWVNANLSDKKPVISEIIRMPQQYQQALGKEYLYFDFNELSELTGSNQPDFSEVMDMSLDLQKKLSDFTDKFIKQYNPDVKINKIGGQYLTQNGKPEYVTLYELRLNDRTFKDLIRYTSNNLLQNEDAIAFAMDYMKIVLKASALPNDEIEKTIKEMEADLKNYKAELPELLKSVNDALDKLENVTLLGPNGITVKYGVNEDGYIINEAGTAEFVIDLPNIMALNKKLSTEKTSTSMPTGVYTLRLDFNTEINNINNPVEITFPSLNSENSVSYIKLMESLMPKKANGWAQEGQAWKFYNNGMMLKNSWAQDSQKNWYFLGSDGVMKTNSWAQDSAKKWYFLDAKGIMVTNQWINYNGKSYYLSKNGSMAVNTTTPDGYKVLSDGSWDGKNK
ncbi:hypothetical protein SH2C18_28490 [Clostridium sediminicola]|uniref:DUF948 domain-containing protein n=1 Tax=Clostridium sediminicola TaxID=3114879 RepID=UPI0031F20E64